MYQHIVEMLSSGQTIPAMDWREYKFFKFLKMVHPEGFAKNGKSTIFVGDTADLIERKEELVEKMKQAGYDGVVNFYDNPVTASATPRAQKNVAAEKRIATINALTEEQLFQRICDTFESLALLSDAAAGLKIRSLIVSGTPGTGKTFEVVKAMKARESKQREFYYRHIKGNLSPISLYIQLYHAKDGVLILDDTDEAFNDPKSLQLLKAATESDKRRLVSYKKLSMALEAEGIPNEFEFRGCVIVLTNTNLEDSSKAKQTHYDAIVSRAHYINALLETNREKIMRIRQVITTTNMLHSFLNEEYHQEVIDFLESNQDSMREISLRTVVKLAELRSAFPDKWEVLARGTLLM